MTKAQKAERDEAIAHLREWIKPGDTVYTILDHVSSSGMSRAIRVVLLTVDRHDDEHKPATVDFLHPNWAVGKALGLRHWKRNGREQDALVVGGCGMDMGFHLVYALSHVLYGGGYDCIGENCPSNEHLNAHHRQACDCGHEGYRHARANNGWSYEQCEQVDCTCLRFRLIPPVDHRGAGVRHTDGYALRHRWL